MIIIVLKWPPRLAFVPFRFAGTDLGLDHWRIGLWFIRRPGVR